MTTSGQCVLDHDKHERATDGLLCRHHSGKLAHTLVDIHDLWFDLALVLEAGSAPKDNAPKTRHTKASSPPAPANLEALSLRDHRGGQTWQSGIPSVPAIVASWVLLVAEERPLTTVLPSSVVGQLDLLQRHHSWICEQLWIDDYVTETTELRTALKGAVRDHTHTRYGDCSHCHGPLFAENGSGVVRCPGCKASWSTPQELARLAVMSEGKTA